MGLFGPKDKRTPDEKYADMKKEIKKSSFTVTREIHKLENELKKIERDIKAEVKKGASPSVIRIKCRTYVQAQKGIEKLYVVRANIESTLNQMALQKAKMIEALAIKKGTAVLQDMSVGMSAQDMMGIVQDYTRELEKFNFSSSLTDEAFELSPDLEDAADEETEKILFEVAGVRMGDLQGPSTHQLEETQAKEAAKIGSMLPSVVFLVCLTNSF